MSVIKFNRNFSTLFSWDTDDNPTTEQDYQNAVKNWTETEMNIVDTLLWQPTTEYATGNIVKTPSLPSQYVLRCAEAGTSGSIEPSYSGASVGDSVTDGTVEWVIVSLATGNVADVDASNIGVNAEVDNSEAWASAIGGGAIAEDDVRLVKGDTVYAVTSELASDIATNTEAIEDNAENIATNTANITQNATDIDIADKRISNIEKLLQGNLYDYQTDTNSAYTKTVPQGAMPYASLEQIGGRTLVWNQLVNSGTTSVATISGHKYYTLISGTASIVTADGTAISVVDDTADMVCDLTLMLGSGKEFANTSDFTAVFPASYYSYNAGTLLSAGVTEVVSKGKNLANVSVVKAFYPSVVTIVSADEFTLTSSSSQTLANHFVDNTAKRSGQVSISYSVMYSSPSSRGVYLRVYYTDGTLDRLYNTAAQNTWQTVSWTSSASKTVDYIVWSYESVGVLGTFKNLQIEWNSTSTTYSPYHAPIQYPIPAEIQALEGYGWSAGSVYNYVDFERKVFVKRVGKYTFTGNETWSDVPNAVFALAITDALYDVGQYVVCDRYVGMVSGTGSSHADTQKSCWLQSTSAYKRFYVCDSNYDRTTIGASMVGVEVFYPLATPQETDISAYLTDDNLISVESGGTLTFENSNGDDYRIDVPSSETYMVDLQASL